MKWYAMQLSALGSVPQLRALWYVHEHEPAIASEVADELGVLDGTARDKLRRLARVGLVASHPDNDRPGNTTEYRLTDRGRTLLSTPPRELLADPANPKWPAG